MIAMVEPFGLLAAGATFVYPKCSTMKGVTYDYLDDPADSGYGPLEFCASEGEMCKCPGGSVRFGVSICPKNWSKKNNTCISHWSSFHLPEDPEGKVQCAEEVFGDPYPKYRKQCWCLQSNEPLGAESVAALKKELYMPEFKCEDDVECSCCWDLSEEDNSEYTSFEVIYSSQHAPGCVADGKALRFNHNVGSVISSDGVAIHHCADDAANANIS